MLLKDLGNRIRAQREKRKLKQQDIANALNISPQAVSKWERGENAPDVTVLATVARLLGVSVDWLLEGDESRDTFDAAVFVSSIRGAHKKSLAMKPREFALWANGVFYELTEVALQHQGIPVKYMGDQFLCFFSGPQFAERAILTAMQARRVIADDLKIAISAGEIYLGHVGHPEYARPDIMGEVVNIAFLAQEWCDSHAEHNVLIAAPVVALVSEEFPAHAHVQFGAAHNVRFKGVREQVALCEAHDTGATKHGMV